MVKRLTPAVRTYVNYEPCLTCLLRNLRLVTFDYRGRHPP